MAKNTKIEWTDHTFNPWRGCTKVSDGCKNCYAKGIGKRFGPDWGPGADRVPATEAMWQQPHKWNRAAARDEVRRRVFCSSMADVFEDHPSIKQAWRDRLWRTIRYTPHLDWLFLTKRPENFSKYLPKNWGFDYSNVWFGVSVEDQKTADERIPLLRAAPIDVRFLSCEPILGEIDLTKHLDYWWQCPECRNIGEPERCAPPAKDDFGYFRCGKCGFDNQDGTDWIDLEDVSWVICGGETGPGARPMNLEWARSLRDQCVDAGIPFFFKSTGGRNKTGRTWREFPA